jgi:hypothetical protein
MLHYLIPRGPHNAGEGMRFERLKAKYRNQYGKLRAERQGQGKLL